MPDRPLPRDTRETRTPFNDNYVIMGIVFVCVLMALALLGAGIIDTRSIFATQPSSQAPVTTHAPAITQPSTQAPATGETKTP